MADVGVEYALATPSGTVTFNRPDAFGAQLYIAEIPGLGGPPIRAPQDDVPFGDGGLIHTFWKAARHITVDGVILIPHWRTMDDIVELRNDYEEILRIALESIIAVDGTLVWTPQGQAERTLVVRHEIMLDFSHDQNYTVETFAFGLVAADPDWTEAT